MEDIHPLNYAPPPPLHRRRTFRRWIYAIVLLGVFVSAWWWTPPAWRRVELLYWQHRCMVYSPPADQIVFGERATTPIPIEWTRFYDLYSPPGSLQSLVVFMHEMHTPNGQRRLVVLQDSLGFIGEYITNRVFVPATLTSAAAELPFRGYGFLETDGNGYAGEIHAGNIDSADPTHFTFRVDTKSGQEIYDGWLENDGSIVMGKRKTAAIQKP